MKLHRIHTLQRKLSENSIDAAIILQHRDLFYYSGTAQPCNLIVPQKGDPQLLVRRGESFVRNETWIKPYETGGSPKQMVQKLKSLGISGGTLGLEFDTVPYGLIHRMAAAFPTFGLVDVSPLIMEQRMVKDPNEIQLLREACIRYDLLHGAMLQHLRPGMTELDLCVRLADVQIRNQVEQRVFVRRWDDYLQPTGAIAGGENSYRIAGHAHTVTGVGLGPAVPWGPSTREIHPGELVVIDMPVNYRGYHADNTRTYVAGRANQRQRDAYRDVMAVQTAALEVIRPGVLVKEVYGVGMDKVRSLGFTDFFQGYGDSQGQYLGHGVGLEVDEPPVIDPKTATVIQKDMVLAVESKFIIPDFGAVFIEDTIHVTDTGYEILTRSPRDLGEAG